MSFRDGGLAVLTCVVAIAGCVRHAGPAGGQLRGVGAGWEMSPIMRDPTLTDRGAAVRIVTASSPSCTHVGYVTGVAGRALPRPVGLTRSEWEATLPWDEAQRDARNLAGAHGAHEIVVDARETHERRSEYEGKIAFSTFVLVHGRVFTCPAPGSSRAVRRRPQGQGPGARQKLPANTVERPAG